MTTEPQRSNDKAAIIVVAYSRPTELARLVHQLSQNSCQHKYDLIISIDKGPFQSEIRDSIANISWPFGDVKIILHPFRHGLKDHVLCCGDLSQNYDYIVVLEEDLIVSRYALEYSHSAVHFFCTDPSIAGISLYSYTRRESDGLQFNPVNDGSDIYFMQFCSSWGQVWTRSQWQSFRGWLSKNNCDMFHDELVPSYICRWPGSSWKKHFIRYMVHNNKYFVYPRVGLSTNPGVDGTHHRGIYRLFSTPILFGPKTWSFVSLSTAEYYYDASFLLANGYTPEYFESCQEFNEGRRTGGASMFFESNPLRSTLLLKVFLLSAINDFKKLLRKALR